MACRRVSSSHGVGWSRCIPAFIFIALQCSLYASGQQQTSWSFSTCPTFMPNCSPSACQTLLGSSFTVLSDNLGVVDYKHFTFATMQMKGVYNSTSRYWEGIANGYTCSASVNGDLMSIACHDIAAGPISTNCVGARYVCSGPSCDVDGRKSEIRFVGGIRIDTSVNCGMYSADTLEPEDYDGYQLLTTGPYNDTNNRNSGTIVDIATGFYVHPGEHTFCYGSPSVDTLYSKMVCHDLQEGTNCTYDGEPPAAPHLDGTWAVSGCSSTSGCDQAICDTMIGSGIQFSGMSETEFSVAKVPSNDILLFGSYQANMRYFAGSGNTTACSAAISGTKMTLGCRGVDGSGCTGLQLECSSGVCLGNLPAFYEYIVPASSGDSNWVGVDACENSQFQCALAVSENPGGPTGSQGISGDCIDNEQSGRYTFSMLTVSFPSTGFIGFYNRPADTFGCGGAWNPSDAAFWLACAGDFGTCSAVTLSLSAAAPTNPSPSPTPLPSPISEPSVTPTPAQTSSPSLSPSSVRSTTVSPSPSGIESSTTAWSFSTCPTFMPNCSPSACQTLLGSSFAVLSDNLGVVDYKHFTFATMQMKGVYNSTSRYWEGIANGYTCSASVNGDLMSIACHDIAAGPISTNCVGARYVCSGPSCDVDGRKSEIRFVGGIRIDTSVNCGMYSADTLEPEDYDGYQLLTTGPYNDTNNRNSGTIVDIATGFYVHPGEHTFCYGSPSVDTLYSKMVCHDLQEGTNCTYDGEPPAAPHLDGTWAVSGCSSTSGCDQAICDTMIGSGIQFSGMSETEFSVAKAPSNDILLFGSYQANMRYFAGSGNTTACSAAISGTKMTLGCRGVDGSGCTGLQLECSSGVCLGNLPAFYEYIVPASSGDSNWVGVDACENSQFQCALAVSENPGGPTGSQGISGDCIDNEQSGRYTFSMLTVSFPSTGFIGFYNRPADTFGCGGAWNPSDAAFWLACAGDFGTCSAVTLSLSTTAPTNPSPSPTPLPSPISEPSVTPTPSISPSKSPSPAPARLIAPGHLIAYEGIVFEIPVSIDAKWSVPRPIQYSCSSASPHILSSGAISSSSVSSFISMEAPLNTINADYVATTIVQCRASWVTGSATAAVTVHVLQAFYPSFRESTLMRMSGSSVGTTRYGFMAVSNGGEVMELKAHPANGKISFMEGERTVNIPEMETTVTISFHIDVTVGGLAVNESTLRVSTGGDSVSFQLPDAQEICGGTCPKAGRYAVLSLRQYTVFHTSQGDLETHQELSCPEKCPGGGSGILYTEACQGYLTGDKCLEAAHAEECAFGGGDECQPCPRGAICPGGFRAWPVAGFWSASEIVTAVEECPPPSTSRCTGYSAASQSVSCAVGYSQDSRLCAACEPGYYLEDGVCFLCPTGNAAVEIAMVPLVVLILLLVAVAIALAIEIHYIFRREKMRGYWMIKLKLAIQVAVWTAINLQLLAQVVRMSTPGLPAPIRSIFSAIQLVQIDLGGVVPPACDHGYTYTRHVAIMTAGLIAFSITLLFSTNKCQRLVYRFRRGERLWSILTSRLLQVIVLLYPLVINTAVSLMECPSFVERTGEVVHLWKTNPYVKCSEPGHVLVAVYAGFIVLYIGCGLPVLLLVVGRRWVLRTLSHQPSSPLETTIRKHLTPNPAVTGNSETSYGGHSSGVEQLDIRGNGEASREEGISKPIDGEHPSASASGGKDEASPEDRDGKHTFVDEVKEQDAEEGLHSEADSGNGGEPSPASPESDSAQASFSISPATGTAVQMEFDFQSAEETKSDQQPEEISENSEDDHGMSVEDIEGENDEAQVDAAVSEAPQSPKEAGAPMANDLSDPENQAPADFQREERHGVRSANSADDTAADDEGSNDGGTFGPDDLGNQSDPLRATHAQSEPEIHGPKKKHLDSIRPNHSASELHLAPLSTREIQAEQQQVPTFEHIDVVPIRAEAPHIPTEHVEALPLVTPASGQRFCRNCCPRWCTVNRAVQIRLMLHKTWAGVFHLGQPWFQPMLLFVFLILAIYDVVIVDVSLSARIGKHSIVFITTVIPSVLIVWLPAEMDWTLWKRIPRFMISFVTSLMAIAQILVAIDEHKATGIDTVPPAWKFLSHESQDNQGAFVEISTSTKVVFYFLIAVALLVPLLSLTTFFKWLRNLLRSRNEHRRAMIRLVDLLLEGKRKVAQKLGSAEIMESAVVSVAMHEKYGAPRSGTSIPEAADRAFDDHDGRPLRTEAPARDQNQDSTPNTSEVHVC